MLGMEQGWLEAKLLAWFSVNWYGRSRNDVEEEVNSPSSGLFQG